MGDEQVIGLHESGRLLLRGWATDPATTSCIIPCGGDTRRRDVSATNVVLMGGAAINCWNDADVLRYAQDGSA